METSLAWSRQLAGVPQTLTHLSGAVGWIVLKLWIFFFFSIFLCLFFFFLSLSTI